jgi:RND family efflux transporter MFP subunit
MNDKSALLNQLRIDRGQEPENGGGGWIKWLLIGAVLLTVAAGAAVLLLMPGGVPVQAVAARAAAASGVPSAGASLLDASGYVVARREATISAKITDKVVEVRIEEGDHVKAGDIVATLDPTNVKAAYDQAAAQLEYARANLAQVKVELGNAQRNYQRDQGLVAQHFISDFDMDTARTANDNLEAQAKTADKNVDVAQQGLEVAQRNLDDTVVRAPFDGVVTDKAAQPGEIVSPISAGGGFTRTGICTLVDMDSLEVEVDVNESFINRVHADQPAVVKLNAYPDWEIPAYVIAIIPTADRSKATVKVRVGMKLKDPRILPEMGARVSFFSEAAPQAAGAPAPAPGVLVPFAAVNGNADGGTLYVIRGNTVERRAVRLGARSGEDVTVLSGITPGERVAVGDFARLKDGVTIKVTQ